MGQVAINDMKVGAADRTRSNFNEHLAMTRAWRLALNELERSAHGLEHHCFHRLTSRLTLPLLGSHAGVRHQRALDCRSLPPIAVMLSFKDDRTEAQT